MAIYLLEYRSYLALCWFRNFSRCSKKLNGVELNFMGGWRDNARAFFLLASLLAITSCERIIPPVSAVDLDSQRPFGLSWDSVSVIGVRDKNARLDECRKLVSNLGALVDDGERQFHLNLCVEGKFETVFIENQRLSPSFRFGEVSVHLRGKSEPVYYTYSFLHRVLPDYSIKDRIRRRLHAFSLRRELHKKYGAPIAGGRFVEYSKTGFVADVKNQGPCDFWIKDDVGILLCSERVIYVDGVEMALSFVRLDRAPFGAALRCMAKQGAVMTCENADGSPAAKLSIDYVSSLEVLGEWIGPDTFRKCHSEKLEPLKSALVLDESEEANLASILDAYSGDSLARYAIEYAGESESDENIPEALHTKILLYLLQKAASQGSAIAMNEIGASLLYCYLGVQQDVATAKSWLERAAALDEAYSIKSLALMKLTGLDETSDPVGDALQLLTKCSVIDPRYCSKDLAALQFFDSVRP